MFCLKNARHCVSKLSAFKCHNTHACIHHQNGNHSNRYLSLLRPTIKEKMNNALLPDKFIVKNNRLPTDMEDRLMLRQRLARNTMGESLLNSMVVSMLRTDYVRSFNMPDTVASYVKFTVLHVYPIVVRLQRYPTKEVQYLRKNILLTSTFEDLKRRLRHNKTDLLTVRRAMGTLPQVYQAIFMRLEEGLASGNGKELAGVIARILYSTQDGGECTMQQLLMVAEWFLESIDILNSYSNEEFSELCVFGEGFDFPLLGDFRPEKPEKLYDMMDVEQLKGLPEELRNIAEYVHNKL